MSLDEGSFLGHFEILGSLGKGGMGEVYRARDLKLDREVAIKVLPEGLAEDQERLARVEREARVLASLNDPHIGHIYGLEESGGSKALVLELVDGPTLAERITEGPIPREEVLSIALQIAEALEAAHEHGIVHRDLKPANIKVRDNGTVKVLDFGLAKALLPPADKVEPALSHSPTLTADLSRLGVVLGTAAYMAPEQARGKPVDKRADIWAFGCVLFEMLAGRRAFQGDDLSLTLAEVIKGEPEWSVLRANSWDPIQRLLRRCLEKDPQRRLRDIGEARLVLGDVISERATEVEFGAERARGRPWGWIAATVVSLLALAAVVLFPDRATSPAGPASAVLSEIRLAPDSPLALGSAAAAIGYEAPVLSLSRDGSLLAYVSEGGQGPMLVLRDMTTGVVTRLAGTEGAFHAAFSPDSRFLAFLTNDRVKRLALQGGEVVTLCEADTPVLIWWPEGEHVYFTEDETWRLSRVAASGIGSREPVLVGNGLTVFSDVLPGGSAALAAARSGIAGDFSDLVVLDLVTGQATDLGVSGYGARYVAPGFVLFGRSGNLMAVPFDLALGATTGEASIVATDVAMDSFFFQVHAASSANGLLAFAAGGDLAVGRLAWVSRVDEGSRVEYLPDEPRLFGALDLSPDGTRLAVQVGDVQDHIWVSEIGGRGYRLQAPGPLGWPLWSPDGRRIVLRTGATSEEPGGYVVRDVDGLGPGAISTPMRSPIGSPNSWSPVEDVLAIDLFEEGWKTLFTRVGSSEPILEIEGHFAQFSPDGRFVAYTTSRGTSANQIYVRPYPDGPLSPPFSLDGGIEPRWNRDTGELFYRKGNKWYGAKVFTDAELGWEEVRLVFDTDFIDTPAISYDISPDGKRLIVVKRAEPIVSDRIQLLANWSLKLGGGR